MLIVARRLLLILLMPVIAHAGTGTVFCAGVIPLPDDPLEVDNTLASANFLDVPSSVIQPHNFNSDLDEDWIRMEGRFTVDPDSGPILYQVQAINFGSGIRFDNPADPAQGTGIRLELIELMSVPISFPIPVVLFTTAGRCGEGGLGDGSPGEELVFEVPHDGSYWVRVSQCRNDPFEVVNDPMSFPQSCIPTAATYDLQITYGEGFQPGFLTGVVRNLDNGQGIIEASIDSIEINNNTFSLQGFGGEPDGIYRMSDTRTRGISATATVMAAGFQPRIINFALDIDKTTTCDIDLAPGPDGLGDPPLFANGFEDPPPGPIDCPPPAPTAP